MQYHIHQSFNHDNSNFNLFYPTLPHSTVHSIISSSSSQILITLIYLPKKTNPSIRPPHRPWTAINQSINQLIRKNYLGIYHLFLICAMVKVITLLLLWWRKREALLFSIFYILVEIVYLVREGYMILSSEKIQRTQSYHRVSFPYHIISHPRQRTIQTTSHRTRLLLFIIWPSPNLKQ